MPQEGVGFSLRPLTSRCEGTSVLLNVLACSDRESEKPPWSDLWGDASALMGVEKALLGGEHVAGDWPQWQILTTLQDLVLTVTISLGCLLSMGWEGWGPVVPLS